MGAHFFTNEYYGTQGMLEAYRSLCEDARYEHGNDPYSGTIATTNGVRLAPDLKPMTYAEAVKVAESRMDCVQKWEACEAIPLVAVTAATWEDLPAQEVALTVTGEVYNDPKQMEAALAKSLKVKPDQIKHYSVQDPKTYKPRVTVEHRVQATVPKEKSETRYFILTGSTHFPKWEDGHPTQAEARAALPKVLMYRGGYGGGDIREVQAEIVGITRRVSGASLVQATVSAKKVNATVTVQLRKQIKPGKVGTEQAGWLFYGWAAE